MVAALLLSACGVTRGDEDTGLHRLRMMVPNSPGGGYDLTARTAVKIMEDDDITGRVEVFNVIGAGGTVAMARLMNEKGNDDLMMTMGLGVVGATYTNGSKIKASDATALAKLIEDPGAHLRARRLAVQDGAGLRRGVEGRSRQGDDRRRLVTRRPRSPVPDGDWHAPSASTRSPSTSSPMTAAVTCSPRCSARRSRSARRVPGELIDQIEAGQLRVLAVSSDERVEGIDAPTLKESGIDLTFANWRGVLAPPGISDDAKQAMVKVLEELHGTQQWKEALVKNGWTDAFMTGAQFEQFLKDQDNRVSYDADRTGADMTTTEESQENAVTRTVDKAQYLVCRRAGGGRRLPGLRRADAGRGFRQGGSRWARAVPDGHRHHSDRAGGGPRHRDPARIGG